MAAAAASQVKRPFGELLQFTTASNAALLPRVETLIQSAVAAIKAYKEAPRDPLPRSEDSSVILTFRTVKGPVYNLAALNRIWLIGSVGLTILFPENPHAAKKHFVHGVIDEFAPETDLQLPPDIAEECGLVNSREALFIPEVGFFAEKVGEKNPFQGTLAGK